MSDSAPVVRIVDDNRSFLTAEARLLQAAGFAVKAFSTAADLLGELNADVPGCVLADLRMPGMDGIQLQAAFARSKNLVPQQARLLVQDLHPMGTSRFSRRRPRVWRAAGLKAM